MTNKLHEAMDTMQASDDMYERVLAQAQGEKRKAYGHAWPKAAALALVFVGVLGTGGVAYAVASGNFFQQALGNHGQGEQTSWAWTEEGQKATYNFSYTREYDSVAASEVSQDLENAVQEVGYTATYGEYTLTIENMIVDENGNGMVTYTLSNPNGLPDYSTNSGDARFDNDYNYLNIVMVAANGSTINAYRAAYDADTSTATELHATLYFADMSGNKLGAFADGVQWMFPVDGLSHKEETAAESKDVRTDVFMPTKVVDVTEFSNGNGVSVSMSPFAVRIVNANVEDELVLEDFCFSLSDGTEKTLLHYELDNGGSSGVVNFYSASVASDSSITYTMTQLVNPDEVESISLTGHVGDVEQECVLSRVS